MRGPMLAGTSFVTAAVILVSWHQGSQAGTGTVAGVHIVAAAPTRRPSTAVPSTHAATAAGPSKATSKGRAASKGRATSKAKAPTSAPTPSRLSLDGALVSTPYGDVQVRAILVGKALTDVQALRLTDSGNRSRQISADAAPILRSEALTAQSAKIDTVSGATYTSEGYRESLQAALDQAHL